ncbi:MAG: M23 family metallopeptidase [Alphaproteobacteria bacterium]|nr:M23 family metallopeptidase [Alphaproteobacteria bacterium]
MDRNAPDEQLSITTAHIVLGKEHIDCQRELVSLLEQGKDASTAMKKAAVAATFAILVGVSYASVAAAAEDNLPDEAAIPCRSVLTVNDGKIPQIAVEAVPTDWLDQSATGEAESAVVMLETRATPFLRKVGVEAVLSDWFDHASSHSAMPMMSVVGPRRQPDGVAPKDNLPNEAAISEQQLLGIDDEDDRFAAYQPFTREIGVSGIISGSFDEAVSVAAVPAATMLEAKQALANEIDLGRDVKRGDRFYVRYEQQFTAAGTAVGVGRVLWAELYTQAQGTIAIHRFRTRDQVERFYLPNGQAAAPTSMRLPLDVVSISSGFGLRADPFGQPTPLATIGKPPPMGGPNRSALPPGLPMAGGSRNDALFKLAPRLGKSFGPIRFASLHPPTSRQSALFMHDGIDLVAQAGTPIYAAGDGMVVGAEPNGRYGNWIRIEHGQNLATVYGHLMAFAPGIQPGEQVVRGELIGFVGSTGRSTGAHLHFELQVDGKPVNPTTSPELKAFQLRGAELARFHKQVAASVAEREREVKVGTDGP